MRTVSHFDSQINKITTSTEITAIDNDTRKKVDFLEMATASMLQWVPDSLYNLSVSVTVCNYNVCRAEVKTLPDCVQFDVLYKVRARFGLVIYSVTVSLKHCDRKPNFSEQLHEL